jgi:myo-inositol 2-dehydrogenase/D-chiro-inositol 1-dehydrogenase
VKEELERAKQKLGVEHCYDNFEDMLGNRELDAVVVASTSSQHCEHIQAALNAGKHVFSEKPLGIDVAQCKIAERAVAAHPDKVFMLGFMRRYDPSYVYTKQKIEKGDIGMPYMYKGTGMDPLSCIDGALAYAGGSGGIFIDLGIHDIDLIRWFLGEDPEEVYAMGGSYAFPRFSEVGDAEAGCAVYKFKSGKMAMIHCARAATHGYHIETEVIGTAGSVRISPVPQKNLAILYNSCGVVTECVETFPERFAESYRLELQEFIDCIAEGRKPDVTVQDGTKSTRIALATKEAFETGLSVRIDYEE